MVKELIDVGLTLASIQQLKNNNTEAKTKKAKEEIRQSNKQISNLRNICYIARRFFR